MSDISKVITQINNTTALPIAITLLTLLIIVFINRHKIHLAWMNIKTAYCLRNLGLDQVSGLVCPDGLGHEFCVDRLLLRHDGITLLVTRKYPGRIYCSDHIDDWTQMLGGKSYRFKNPLFELDYQIKALAECVPGVPIDGYLFFDHQSEFPKGHPQRVIHPARIPHSIHKTKQQPVDSQVIQAWQKLKSMSSN